MSSTGLAQEHLVRSIISFFNVSLSQENGQLSSALSNWCCLFRVYLKSVQPKSGGEAENITKIWEEFCQLRLLVLKKVLASSLVFGAYWLLGLQPATLLNPFSGHKLDLFSCGGDRVFVQHTMSLSVGLRAQSGTLPVAMLLEFLPDYD